MFAAVQSVDDLELKLAETQTGVCIDPHVQGPQIFNARQMSVGLYEC